MTPAGTRVNRLATDLTTWEKSGDTAVALVSSETDPDGLATYKLTALDTTTNRIERTTHTGRCPRGVPCVARILVYADTVGFAIFNGPAGAQTGKYEIDLADGCYHVLHRQERGHTRTAPGQGLDPRQAQQLLGLRHHRHDGRNPARTVDPQAARGRR